MNKTINSVIKRKNLQEIEVCHLLILSQIIFDTIVKCMSNLM